MIRSSTIGVALALGVWGASAGCIQFPEAPAPGFLADAAHADGTGTTDVQCFCPLTCNAPCRDVSILSAGRNATCALVDQAAVCWGTRSLGGHPSAGLGPTGPRWVGVNALEVQAVSTGAQHSCALDGVGQVHCWGNNSYAQTSGGATTGTHLVAEMTGADAIITGDYTSCARQAGIGLFCWGLMLEGPTPNETQPVTPGLATSMAPQQVVGVPGDTDLVTIGRGHGCAARADGPDVYCWGANDRGQLGVDEPAASAEAVVSQPFGSGGRISALASGGDTTCAVDAEAAVVCWGSNLDGVLGEAPTGLLDSSNPLTVMPPVSAVTELDLGDHHACALGPEGVACWGGNDACQLGFESAGTTWAPQLVPDTVNASLVAAGGTHTCAQVGDRVLCWGGDDKGQLGTATPTAGGCAPVDVLGLSRNP